MAVMHQPAPGSGRTSVAREDPAFGWYIGAALVAAVAGGFALALLLPLAAALDWGWGVRWRALVQAHGHLQVGGWLGLFIAGMAFRLVPRFAGRPLRFAGLTRPALILLIAGLVGRTVTQPWLDAPAMEGLLTLSALAELAGAACFAVVVVSTLAPALRSLPAAPLLALGALGFVAQAALAAVWLAQLDGASPVLPADRDSALLSMQFYAFLLPFVLGVSMRALPSFFAYPSPSSGRMWGIVAALAIGSLLYAGAPLLLDGARGVRVAQAGGLLLAAAIVIGVTSTGVWRSPERLRASARPAAVLIRTAYAWLLVVALALAWLSAVALYRGEPVPQRYDDAIRHALALGVFSTLLVGMAHLVLPWLAMRRQRRNDARREVWTLWTLLTGAAILRVAGALLDGGTGTDRFRVMAVGGVLAILAVAGFATAIWRAARQRPEIPLYERPSSAPSAA